MMMMMRVVLALMCCYGREGVNRGIFCVLREPVASMLCRVSVNADMSAFVFVFAITKLEEILELAPC